MQRIPEDLQRPVIIECVRPLAREPQIAQKPEFLGRDISAKRGILEKFAKPGLVPIDAVAVLFDEGESSRFSGQKSFVEHYLHIECRQVDIPARQQRAEEGNAVGARDVEDVGIKELEDDYSHLRVTPGAELRNLTKPVFVFQLGARGLAGEPGRTFAISIPESLSTAHPVAPHNRA